MFVLFFLGCNPCDWLLRSAVIYSSPSVLIPAIYRYPKMHDATKKSWFFVFLIYSFLSLRFFIQFVHSRRASKEKTNMFCFFVNSFFSWYFISQPARFRSAIANNPRQGAVTILLTPAFFSQQDHGCWRWCSWSRRPPDKPQGARRPPETDRPYLARSRQSLLRHPGGGVGVIARW